MNNLSSIHNNFPSGELHGLMRTKEFHPFPDLIAGPGSYLELRDDLPLAPTQTASPEMTNFDSDLQKSIVQPAGIQPDFPFIPRPVIIPFQSNA
ncbi:MAG TPA: hypothetical protein PK509_09445 [Catalimonadaceae bacterium]|nr:hypothetical protein [Catalimonadaceae bacterium]